MAAQGLQAPWSLCTCTPPQDCASTSKSASATSASVPSKRSLHHARLGFTSNSFLPSRVSLNRLKGSTSSDLIARSKGRGGVARAAALFQLLGLKNGDKEKVKFELLTAIAPLSRGAEASAEDCARVDDIARELEKLNPTKDPLTSPLINGKWKLIYTTSESILKKSRPGFLRPNGAIYQAINADTLRAQNVETWPYFNQVTANLEAVSASKVIVKFDFFKIAGLISVKAPGRARGELDITYLDDELRISRGDRGNLFVLVMDDPDYRVPL